MSVSYNVILGGHTFDSEIDVVVHCVFDYLADILIGLDEDHCSSILFRKSGPSFQTLIVGRVGGDNDIPFENVPEGVESVGMYECHV